jgi:hypothetical protein
MMDSILDGRAQIDGGAVTTAYELAERESIVG